MLRTKLFTPYILSLNPTCFASCISHFPLFPSNLVQSFTVNFICPAYNPLPLPPSQLGNKVKFFFICREEFWRLMTLTIVRSCMNSESHQFHFSSTLKFDIWLQQSKTQFLREYQFPHIRPIRKLQSTKLCEHFLVQNKDSSKYNAVKEGKLLTVCAVRANKGRRGIVPFIFSLGSIWW